MIYCNKTLIKLLLLIVLSCFSSEKKYYFYNPNNDFGSDLLFNPFYLVVNGSYDIFRNHGHSKDIFDQHYVDGFNNVMSSLLDPIPNIRSYGWNRFLSQEFFNLDLNKDKSNFLPNFADHTIGNGMQYAKLAEWFDYHGYKYPRLSSLSFTVTYQLMNEILENGEYKGPNIDAIADVYVFNTLGFALFEWDFTKKFFTEILPLYDWSLQPIIDLRNNNIENVGQQYIVRRRLPYMKNISGFFNWGLKGVLGLSYSYNKIHNFSIGAGQVASRLKENRDKGLRFLSPDLDGAFVFYYDKNNSLLFSATYTGPRNHNVRFNIYPGLFEWGNFKPGVYIGAGQIDKFIVGVSFTHYLPASIGCSFVD